MLDFEDANSMGSSYGRATFIAESTLILLLMTFINHDPSMTLGYLAFALRAQFYCSRSPERRSSIILAKRLTLSLLLLLTCFLIIIGLRLYYNTTSNHSRALNYHGKRNITLRGGHSGVPQAP